MEVLPYKIYFPVAFVVVAFAFIIRICITHKWNLSFRYLNLYLYIFTIHMNQPPPALWLSCKYLNIAPTLHLPPNSPSLTNHQANTITTSPPTSLMVCQGTIAFPAVTGSTLVPIILHCPIGYYCLLWYSHGGGGNLQMGGKVCLKGIWTHPLVLGVLTISHSKLPHSINMCLPGYVVYHSRKSLDLTIVVL